MPEEWLAVSWKPSGYGAVAAAAAALHVVLYGGVMAAGRQPGDKSVAVVSRRISRRDRRRISRRDRRRSLAESTEDLSQRSPSAQRKAPALLGVLCDLCERSSAIS